MSPCGLIAGAASGIGEATAKKLLAEGWRVAVVGRRAERLRALAALAPASVLPLPLDITDEAALSAALPGLRAWTPTLDALVISAGDFLVAPIEATAAAEFERIWRVTVLAKFLLVRELLPLLRAGAAPRAIVHVASLAAHQDFPNESAYAGAMHAVIGMARSQDLELRDRGIRVCTVSPGLVRTELTERSGFSAADLAQALPAEAVAATIWHSIETIRQGGYIADVLHLPGGVRY